MAHVDLHCHSTASDGSLSPVQVVQLAQRNGLSGLSLTDHDTIGGIDEAAAEARRLGIDFIPGIEISCEFAPGTMHLLGYGVVPHSPPLQQLTRELVDARDNRNPRIVQRLNQLGVTVTMEEWEQEAGGKVVGRPHLAAILVRKGYVSSVKHAFDKYLGQGAAAYVDKERLSPRKALELIRQSGGIPVLAHPSQLRLENDAQVERVVKDLLDLGLEGIEVLHSDHQDRQVEVYCSLAERWKLLKTGGSDFHGASKKDIQLGLAGNRRIPREYFDRLAERLKRAG